MDGAVRWHIIIGATAGFFFYSHNSAGLNRYRCKGQTVVNLWHGCGYKDAEQGKKKQNIKPDFDLCTCSRTGICENEIRTMELRTGQAVNDGISQI